MMIVKNLLNNCSSSYLGTSRLGFLKFLSMKIGCIEVENLFLVGFLHSVISIKHMVFMLTT